MQQPCHKEAVRRQTLLMCGRYQAGWDPLTRSITPADGFNSGRAQEETSKDVHEVMLLSRAGGNDWYSGGRMARALRSLGVRLPTAH